MTITVEAVVRGGQLKLEKPVDLAEGTPVQVQISLVNGGEDPLASVIGIGKSGRADGADNHDRHIYKRSGR